MNTQRSIEEFVTNPKRKLFLNRMWLQRQADAGMLIKWINGNAEIHEAMYAQIDSLEWSKKLGNHKHSGLNHILMWSDEIGYWMLIDSIGSRGYNDISDIIINKLDMLEYNKLKEDIINIGDNADKVNGFYHDWYCILDCEKELNSFGWTNITSNKLESIKSLNVLMDLQYKLNKEILNLDMYYDYDCVSYLYASNMNPLVVFIPAIDMVVELQTGLYYKACGNEKRDKLIVDDGKLKLSN